MNGADVLAAARACTAVLEQTIDLDWTQTVPDLGWTVAQTVAHAADCCIWYATDLAAGGRQLDTAEVRVKADAAPADLAATIEPLALVLARVVDGTPPTGRGWHPFGMADSSGFAAMACDELLVHTGDVARVFDLDFAPDGDLCERTLRRLFPWAPAGVDPWDGLRWANGRIALEGHPRVEGWRWHCAPVDEWSGRPPRAYRRD